VERAWIGLIQPRNGVKTKPPERREETTGVAFGREARCDLDAGHHKRAGPGLAKAN
jgi:hypothetical protein